MATLTLVVQRTFDNRDQAERIRQLEAQNAALRERIKALEARLPPGIKLVGGREVTRYYESSVLTDPERH